VEGGKESGFNCAEDVDWSIMRGGGLPGSVSTARIYEAVVRRIEPRNRTDDGQKFADGVRTTSDRQQVSPSSAELQLVDNGISLRRRTTSKGVR
jgi:hypothetical protein